MKANQRAYARVACDSPFNIDEETRIACHGDVMKIFRLILRDDNVKRKCDTGCDGLDTRCDVYSKQRRVSNCEKIYCLLSNMYFTR